MKSVMTWTQRVLIIGATLATAGGATMAAAPSFDERPATLSVASDVWGYERRTAEIAMRDGITLHTVILIPKGAHYAPILLTRTPYDADHMTAQAPSGNLVAALDGYDNATDIIVAGGYIRVIQDVRGKFGSQGSFVMNRPLVGNGLNRTSVDDASDCYDTIDWLVKNVPESNHKVGVVGISYDGFEALEALVNPHPALKVSVAMNPMVDGWRGDDWFHNGAFRQIGIDYVWETEASRDSSAQFAWDQYDHWDAFMRAGSAGALGKAHGLNQLGFWRNLEAHPAYDPFWKSQAIDQILAREPLKVPVMLVHSLWDQEDIYGAPAVYKTIKPKDVTGDLVYLSLGPWHHAQEIGDGSATGSVKWDQDTAKWWRWHVLAPFLAHWLKGTPMDVAPVTAFQSGSNIWQRLNTWPDRSTVAKLYLKPGMELGFSPAATGPSTADYRSDPAHPVAFIPRPIFSGESETWKNWLTSDQRNVSTRPDVLTFSSGVLDKPVTITGEPVVHLTASTSGSDSDWVVKLIDVYPDEVPIDTEMGGYQLGVAMDIFRGRYRVSFGEPRPLQPNRSLAYVFALPDVNHVFLTGHRIMVQVQSSWFPLYDRNPQTFVSNIFLARPSDYVPALQKIMVSGPDESFIELPVQP